jgi:hypothetical protein
VFDGSLNSISSRMFLKFLRAGPGRAENRRRRRGLSRLGTERRVAGSCPVALASEPPRATAPHHPKETAMTTSTTTTDHDTIRRWAEARDGNPALVRGTGEDGVLRIDFNEREDRLDPINWDEFFRVFEQNNLAFLYQEKTADGSTSRFNKLVRRDTA